MSHNHIIIQTEVVEFHGYLAIATFIHYLVPGSLKIRTDTHVLNFSELGALLDRSTLDSISFQGTRRWLQKGEAPYPGYCRAPGSATCIPLLCNCKKLTEIWNEVQKRLT